MVEEYKAEYGKRPLWQWIAIYAVIGLIIYGLIYYFVIAKPRVAPVVAPSTTSSEATSSTTETVQDQVTLTANGFSPATLTVKTGTKVTWTNQGGSGATVSSDPHPIHTNYAPLNLGNFPDGGKLSLTFEKPGTYGYHNHLNPSQTATVIVQE